MGTCKTYHMHNGYLEKEAALQLHAHTTNRCASQVGQLCTQVNSSVREAQYRQESLFTYAIHSIIHPPVHRKTGMQEPSQMWRSTLPSAIISFHPFSTSLYSRFVQRSNVVLAEAYSSAH